MRRLQLIGFVVISGLAFARLAEAQEASATKPARHRIVLAEPLAAGKTLDELLEAKGTFQAEAAALKSFVAALETALDMTVVLRTKKLEEAAVSMDTPLTYKLTNVRIKTALKLILGELGLSYVSEDNVLVVTTPEDAGSKYVTRVYDCCDLLDANEDSAQGLFEEITTLVHPDSWDFSGPAPSADFKGLLIISQTQEVHQDVEKFLNQLHQALGIAGKVKVQK